MKETERKKNLPSHEPSASGVAGLQSSKKVMPKKDLSSKIKKVDVVKKEIQKSSPQKRDKTKERGDSAKKQQEVELPSFSFFQERYITTIRPDLQKRLGYVNVHQVPSLSKVVLNMGIGDAAREKGKIEKACEEMGLIAGQKAVIARARCSVAAFKLRAGMPVGVKVTLRKRKMYEFLERVIYIALPSVRDFRGLSSKSFDQQGNYSFGIKEHIIFPEIGYDNVETIRGMDVTICTTAYRPKEAKMLLEGFSFPLVGELS